MNSQLLPTLQEFIKNNFQYKQLNNFQLIFTALRSPEQSERALQCNHWIFMFCSEICKPCFGGIPFSPIDSHIIFKPKELWKLESKVVHKNYESKWKGKPIGRQQKRRVPLRISFAVNLKVESTLIQLINSYSSENIQICYQTMFCQTTGLRNRHSKQGIDLLKSN